VAALGHKWDEGEVTLEPTEYEDGEMTYTCLRCGDTRTESIPANGHEHDYKAVTTVDPTCTEQGYTVYACTCGEDGYNADFIAALGHEFDYTAAVDHKDATCAESGYDVYKCVRCDETETEIIPALGHAWVSAVTAPTCTEQGYTTYTCSVCNESKVRKYVAALGHDFVLVDHRDATADEDGYDYYECSRCDETKTVVIPATGATTLIGAATSAKDFVGIKETAKNSRVWVLSFKVTETYSNGETKVVTYSINLDGNNANLNGEYTFEAGHTLAGYTLVYDIKGTGSNIKEFKVILN